MKIFTYKIVYFESSDTVNINTKIQRYFRITPIIYTVQVILDSVCFSNE